MSEGVEADSGGTTDGSPLVLGPMLRYVDETSASIWVETRDAGTVVVRAGGDSWSARTFGAHGHHYALVEASGLEPGTRREYSVEFEGARVWPPRDGEYPAPSINTLHPDRRLRMAFGSCRTSVPHDQRGHRTHGVDAMRSYALALASGDEADWPDLALFLGDQVYADVTSEEMKDFIRARRDIEEVPGPELKDYEEYAHLYRLAWSDAANRWLLSTLPSAMIFDDHDIRDDWNASQSWRRKMEATSWWHGRIVAGLGSYWIYQHLGNLSPDQRAEDELWQMVAGHDGAAELDLTDALDALADRADRDPASYRWSYARDFGDVRLIVVDSRSARVLEPAERSLLDEPEMEWLDGKMRGGFRHLLIGTSLPFLLPAGLHHVESWNEAVSTAPVFSEAGGRRDGGARRGMWGRTGERVGERLRQGLDLEHWAAFQRSFHDMARMAMEVADGRRGTAPETVTFLSGDVHFSYVSEVERDSGSRLVQAVCSPIRNPLPRFMRFFSAAMAYGPAAPMGAAVARSMHVPDPPFKWNGIKGPWFDNNLAVLEDTTGGLILRWVTGVVRDGDHEHPGLDTVAELTLGERSTPDAV
ncbi:alkaline phosphatase D family protein [Arthrobacter halodurans]|uniref:Alkaline phosphatase D family protein n=1 Tax=Arthrobacter halodurans TaxID=516699 RepID=A0ABV4URJ5_9MICC